MKYKHCGIGDKVRIAYIALHSFSALNLPIRCCKYFHEEFSISTFLDYNHIFS